MRFGGARADREAARDAGAAVALGNELQDLPLAAGERLVGILGAARGPRHPDVDHLLVEGRPEVAPSARGHADRPHQLGGVGLPHDVAEGSAAQRLGDVPLAEVAREDHHAGARRQLAHAARDLEAVETGHRDVGDQHVGLQPLGERQDLQAVGRFADHLHVVLALDEAAQGLADDLLVVREQNASHLGLPDAPGRTVHSAAQASQRARGAVYS